MFDKDKGLIFDIQSFSVHDGPGCRTTVFFAGCPLRCKWCANPESFGNKRHIMFAEKSCKWEKGCIACKDVCPKNGIIFEIGQQPQIDWGICKDCTTFECTEYCPNNALKMCGKEYSVDDLMKILIRDFSNWGSAGGVTFSGGEPMLQHEFLVQVLKRCKEAQIHTAIETSSYIDNKSYLETMKYINFAFTDIKHMDREKHIEGTGVSNDIILENISSLKKSGWKGRLVLRQPTIAGYNDSTENAKQLIEFMHQNDLYEINLLTFHRMGETKWNQLGMEYAYRTGGTMSTERMLELQSLYLNNDIACYIGSDTPF